MIFEFDLILFNFSSFNFSLFVFHFIKLLKIIIVWLLWHLPNLKSVIFFLDWGHNQAIIWIPIKIWHNSSMTTMNKLNNITNSKKIYQNLWGTIYFLFSCLLIPNFTVIINNNSSIIWAASKDNFAMRRPLNFKYFSIMIVKGIKFFAKVSKIP